MESPVRLFEPTDLLSFDEAPPTPPRSNQSDVPSAPGKVVEMHSMRLEMEIDLDIPPAASRRRIMDDSPPPDMEEEPSDFEDDVRAMMERSDEDRHSLPPSSLPKPVPSFGASELLDFDVPEPEDMPVASSSRVPLTPPPEETFVSQLETQEPCFLPSLLATTAAGDTVTIKRRHRPISKAASGQVPSSGQVASNLLATPLHHLLKEVEELKSQQKALELQRRFDEERRRERLGQSIRKKAADAPTMWVDKYRPKQFADLLGEDRVHREVLSWLKEWDKCVFKRTSHVKKRRFENDENIPIDPLGRPRDRIVLLSGPPGYGKTTLAHIVARQAGYKTLEINASDDRSAATVTSRIKNAIDAGTGLGSEGKPTCVVIDEIDGASGGGDTSFIRSLIKLIQDVPANRKRNTAAKPLRRPIICICNDLYAPSLRQLRPFARVIRFRKPQAQFLVKRLRDICDKETLTADLRVLTTLVDVTSGDVRSCLNTLQFIKSRSATVTDEAIKTSSVGLKDSGTTLQSVWNSLFIPVAAKQRRKTQGIDDGRFVDRLAFQVQACGDYDKVVQGLFEHYPNLKPIDASLENLNKLHDWVEYYDRISTKINETQEYEMMAYLPYALVPWYSHMAAPANNARPTEWPKADYEAYQARLVNEEVSTSFKSTVTPIMRSLFSPTTTLTELIPLLMRIISPPLKPVNANIVKSAEKAVLSRLVDLMIPLGLKFWQEKGENGQPMMRLEPPIDVFVHYDGKRADDIAASRFAVRQLVAQAMDAELARRRGADAPGGGTETAQSLAGAYGIARNGGSAAADASKAKEATATDFFGRKIVKPAPVIVSAASDSLDSLDVFTATEPPVKKFRALYKFHEGSSCAVRKNIKMSALM